KRKKLKSLLSTGWNVGLKLLLILLIFLILALELMLPRSLKKNTKCVNAVGEELSVVKHKLKLLDIAAERS
nr:hypothetical protein [Tanacetum cinerariifolium]